MKKIITILSVLMILTATATAVSLEKLIEIKTNRLTDDLNLDSRQHDLVAGILTEYSNEVFDKTEHGHDPMSSLDHNPVEDAYNRLAKVLTQDQKENTAILGYPMVPAPELLKLNMMLDLDSCQIPAIEAIVETYDFQIRRTLDDIDNSKQTTFKTIKSLKQKQSDKIESELTFVQREKYNEFRDEIKKPNK